MTTTPREAQRGPAETPGRFIDRRLRDTQHLTTPKPTQREEYDLETAQATPEEKLSRLLALLIDSRNPLGPSHTHIKVWQDHTQDRDLFDKLAATVAAGIAQQDHIDCDKYGMAGEIGRIYEVTAVVLTQDTILTTLTPTRPDAASIKLVTLPEPAGFYLMKTKEGVAHSRTNTDTGPDPAAALAALTQALAQEGKPDTNPVVIGKKPHRDQERNINRTIHECVVQRLHTTTTPVTKNLDKNTVVQLRFLQLDPQARIFLTEYRTLESIGPDRQLIFHDQAQTGFVFCERTPERSRPAPDTTVTALVTGTQETMANAAATLGLTLNYVEAGDDHHLAPYTDGPAILGHVASTTHCENPPDWQNLTHEEKRALVSLAANSTWWYEGQIDDADLERMLLNTPSLTEKLTPGTNEQPA